MKQDNRVIITKKMIRDAFLQLLKEKSIDHISVKELCEKANINRGTFYIHYNDIYDLLNHIENELYDDFKIALFSTPMIQENTNNPYQFTARIFECVKDNADICAIILGENGDKNFMRKLIELGKEVCIETYRQYFKNASITQIEYFYTFVSYGCIGVLEKWILEGFKLSEKEIADMIGKIMSSGVNYFFSE